MRDPSNQGGSARSETYHVERLDDVNTRLSRIEGRMESLATKEDVANAKIQLYTVWGVAAITVIIGIANVLARIWPS